MMAVYARRLVDLFSGHEFIAWLKCELLMSV